jgi:hypothetical protein
MPRAVKVRKETVANDKKEIHAHIVGVITEDGLYHTNQDVVRGISAGQDWYTMEDGKKARIRPLGYCPNSSCYHKPYITTNPDHTTANNLENLPRG